MRSRKLQTNPSYGGELHHLWRYGVALIAMGTLAVVGCKDTRISLDDLDRMETEVMQVEPTELAASELALTELQPYQVGPGDVLLATLTGLESQFGQTHLQLRVHDDGTILLPMVGKVNVAGLDLKQVEAAIYEAHVPEFVKDMSIFIELGGPETTTVVVIGAAGNSGLVQLPSNERNIVYALGHASAFSPVSSGCVKVHPVRPDRPVANYNLTDIHDLRRALLAPPLESGDMIVVEPADASVIYVTGLVNAPMPVPVPKHGTLSLMRTISAAGGLVDFLEPDEATLWRVLPNGNQVRVKLPLDDMLEGEAPDIALLPGDILDVPHTTKTRLRAWAAANIRIGPFGVTAMYDPVADYRARILRNENDNSFLNQSLLPTLRTGVAELLVPAVTN